MKATKKAMGGMMPMKTKKPPMAMPAAPKMPMPPKGKAAMPFKKGGKAKGC